MSSVLESIGAKYKKARVIDVRSGDTVKVHQKIREGNKERVQVFQGLVIRVDRKGSHTSRIVVRRIASGVGVEKSFLLNSPLVTKIEVTKRSKVRRNYLTYMRERTGKSARLTSKQFDRQSVNDVGADEPVVPADPVAPVEEQVDEAIAAPAEETSAKDDQPAEAAEVKDSAESTKPATDKTAEK